VSIRASVARFTLTLLVSALPIVQAAGIYRCTQADGSVTLSDLACPADTLTREYQGEATGSRGSKAPAHDPYSIMEQVRGIEKREKAERKAAAKERKRDKVQEEMAKDRHGPSKSEAKRATASGKRRKSGVARGDTGEGCASAGKGNGGGGKPGSCASAGRDGKSGTGIGAVISHHR